MDIDIYEPHSDLCCIRLIHDINYSFIHRVLFISITIHAKIVKFKNEAVTK